MQNIEDMILEEFIDVSYESGGEIYLPIIEANKFILWCVEKQVIMYTIEIFEKLGTSITPYSNTISIDSSTIFDEDLTWDLNVKNCNLFIEEKANAIRLDNPSLYFSFVVELDPESF